LTAIREYDAKLLVNYWLPRAPLAHSSLQVSDTFNAPAPRVAQISWDSSSNTITNDSALPSWIHNTKLVAKPDQLIKRRGKAGLLKLNADWPDAKAWIAERAGKPQKVS
jgi:ATP citrate (pro-S)-lyase